MLIRMGCTLLLKYSVAGAGARAALHAREASRQCRVIGAERRLEDFLAVPLEPGRMARARWRCCEPGRVIDPVAAADGIAAKHPATGDALDAGLGFRG